MHMDQDTGVMIQIKNNIIGMQSWKTCSRSIDYITPFKTRSYYRNSSR